MPTLAKTSHTTDFDLENSTGQDKVQGSPDQDGQRSGFLREWAKWAANGQDSRERRGSDRGTGIHTHTERESVCVRGATEAKQSPKIHFWSQHSCGTSTARPNSLDSLSWHLAVVRPLSLLLAAVEKEEQEGEGERV